MRQYGFAFTLLSLLFAGYWLLHDRAWLSISQDTVNGSHVLYLTQLPEKSRFCVRFKHSVALTPVEEWFVAHNGQVALKSTVYEDFGAGLPHDIAEGQSMKVDDGKVIITGQKMFMYAMYVRVGRVAEHELIIEKERGVPFHSFRLDTLAKPGEALKFSIKTDSYAHVLWKYWETVQL